jgi:hypothetical protein
MIDMSDYREVADIFLHEGDAMRALTKP